MFSSFQTPIPTTIPEVRNLRIAVAYRPMTAVGSDFYDRPRDSMFPGHLPKRRTSSHLDT